MPKATAQLSQCCNGLEGRQRSETIPACIRWTLRKVHLFWCKEKFVNEIELIIHRFYSPNKTMEGGGGCASTSWIRTPFSLSNKKTRKGLVFLFRFFIIDISVLS